jgi:hypothetical protein
LAATPPGSDWLAIQNLDRVPYEDRLVVQRVAENFNSDWTKKNAIVRVTNITNAPVTVTSSFEGGDVGNFRFRFNEDKSFTLAPSAFQDVDVQMIVIDEGKTDIGVLDGRRKGPRRTTLTFRTPGREPRTLELEGFMMPDEQGNFEPTLQQLLDVFGYSTQVVRPNSNENLRGDTLPSVGKFRSGVYAADGDEILSTRWRRAGSGKMYVRQLAALHKRELPENTPRISLPGGSIQHCPDDFQSFLPRGFSCVGPAEMQVEPSLGSSFVIQGTGRTEPNEAGLISGRVWPVRDRAGYLIPNTYIFAQDYICASTEPDCTYANYDYQDNVWLITNMKPDDAKQDPATPAKKPGDPALVLDFSKTAGGLNDKDGQGTGFPITQRNREDSNAPQNGPGSSYNPSKIDLNTGAGTLTIAAEPYTNAGRDDQLRNGLCLPFDGRTGKFVISSRLLGPFNDLSTPTELEGMMYGPHQGTYIRLAVGTPGSNAPNNRPFIQLAYEIDNTLTQIGPLVQLPDAANVQTLDLQLLADPVTGKVEAFYRVDGGLLIPMPESVQLAAPQIGRFFDPQSKGCLFTSSKGAGPVNAVYDRFAIETAPDESQLPNVNAGPDQKVPLGATVTLNGTASDANGAALTGTWQQIGGPPVTLSGTGNSRTFQAPGSFAVLGFAFGATDGQGRSKADTVQIRVGDEPISNLQISSNSPVEAGQIARFNATVGGGELPIVYEWNFGDNSPVQIGGASVGHRYATPGTYTVSVKATNAAGSVSVQTSMIVNAVIPDFALRYDIGSTSDRQVGGVTWKRDNGIYSPSVAREFRNAPTIGGLSAAIYDADLYRSYRGAVGVGNTFNINIPLNSQVGAAPGVPIKVDVWLHFAEVYWGGAAGAPDQGGTGRRVFDISIEGSKRVDNYDIFSAAGGADRARIERFTVTVTDGTLNLSFLCEKDNVSIAGVEVLKVKPDDSGNQPPTPFAGNDQLGRVGQNFTLSGSATDPDADAVTLEWTQVGGPAATLTGSGATRGFTPSQPGEYVFRLTASDSAGLSGTDDLNITVTQGNLPPSADAGNDQTATVGQQVTLLGQGSDPDGDALTFAWTQISGPPASLSNASAAQPTFTPGAIGTYIFNLTVSDPSGNSATDTVVVTIIDPANTNRPPTAEAGANRATSVGQPVTLLAQGSDPDGDALTFEWTQTAGPAVTLEGSGATRSFTPTQPGTYVFTVIVSDAGGLQGADSVTIIVREPGSLAPQAYVPLMLTR